MNTPTDSNAILCKDVLRSFDIDLGDGKSLPESLQWMPPGKHTVTAKQAGQTVTRNVIANAAGAQRMNSLLQELRIKAASGAGDLPFLDFNHDDREAAFHPTEFFWAGDDSKTGGIRAKGEWTKPGGEAVLGKSFRRFSPAFHLNASGEVIGAPINMGGLVNRAAFQTIQPLFAKEAEAQTEKTHMKKDPLKDSPATIEEAGEMIAALRAKHAESESAKAIEAKDTKIKELEGKIVAFETAQKEQQKNEAKAIVAKAVTDGKIGPKDTDTQKHYEDLLIAAPVQAKAIIEKLEVNPAFKTVVTDPAAIQAKAGEEKKDDKKEPPTAASVWGKKK